MAFVRSGSAALIVLGLAAPAAAQSDVAPGVTLYDEAGTHVVVVELDRADISFEVSEPELRGSTVSEYARARGALVALNGGPFSLATFTPSGLTVGGGRAWSGTTDDGDHALLAVDVDGCGGIYRAEPWIARERWMYGAVSGSAIVTAEGRGVDPESCAGQECGSGAQSAVGLSADGRRMVLLAADAGTPREAGDALAAHGAWVGMLLEGGSSTALSVAGAVVNNLSDGVERRVASHLGVFSGRAPRAWDVRGLVPGQPRVDVELRTFWDAPLEGRTTVPTEGDGPDGLFQFMPVPFRNIRIATADRCLYTGFTGPEDVRLWWSVDAGSTCPPAECTRVADAWAVTEPTCDDAGAADRTHAAMVPAPTVPFVLAALALACAIALWRRPRRLGGRTARTPGAPRFPR